MNHGPTIINPPNYGLYPGGYQVREHGLGINDGNYLSSHNPGLIPIHGRPLIPAIQPLGHTGYAYAPAAKNHLSSSAVAVVPRIQHQAYTGQIGHLGHLGQVGHLGQIGQIGHFGQVGHLGQIGHLGHVGHLGHSGHLGQIGHLGYQQHGGQGNFVVPPSVTFSQNAPQKIAPISPVSNSIRIPYSFPVINAPQPLSQGVDHSISAHAHGW